ncbi:MAG: hypothetical protein Greene041639_399 [Parcubacteria group bacterium Greene0416_39]|nr:MAG: hypothetical protein Greene041639_399 [Parcubacteria group bacterium Greene0416_39]
MGNTYYENLRPQRFIVSGIPSAEKRALRRRLPTLAGKTLLSSALEYFTSVFGMGTGGTTPV